MFLPNRRGLLSSQEREECDGAELNLTNWQAVSEQEDNLAARFSSDPCRRANAVWKPSFQPQPSTICNYTDWWTNAGGKYDVCYKSKTSAEEASNIFKKMFLHFHFLTTTPYPRLGVYKRMRFRFPVPLLNSEYSLQSHCFRSLEWPTSEHGDVCVPQKTGSLGSGAGSCILGVCWPNLVNYLPNAYLAAYKHLTLELCHNAAPPSLKLPPSVQSCQPTVLSSLDAKGKITQSWSLKVHRTMADAWSSNTAIGIIEKGCYTCNTVSALPSSRVCACSFRD